MIQSVYTCDSCLQSADPVDDGEQPAGWITVEDDECVWEYCSAVCAMAGLLSTAESRGRLPS